MMDDASISAPYLRDDADAYHAAHPCPGCPHTPYTHAHQRWLQPGPKDRGRVKVDPWNTPTWKARHPGWNAGRRALRWLEVEFGP